MSHLKIYCVHIAIIITMQPFGALAKIVNTLNGIRHSAEIRI